MDKKDKRKNLACMVEKVPKGIIKREFGGGEYIPYCNGRYKGIIQNERGCDKEKCEFYQKRYLK